MRKNRLTSQQMTDCLTVFAEAQQKTISLFSENEQEEIMGWMRDISLTNPVLMLRPDNVIAMNTTIVSSEIIRHYVSSVTFLFFATAGNVDDFETRLCNNLVQGLALDGPRSELSTIPEELRHSMVMSLYPLTALSRIARWFVKPFKRGLTITVNELLVNNKHLISVILMYMINGK